MKNYTVEKLAFQVTSCRRDSRNAEIYFLQALRDTQ